uniref:Yippee domain-containing protein n=1 Tax=Ascaris lumbricoides TaxID=6252 RepID=A0A0M3HIK6_ASCLU
MLYWEHAFELSQKYKEGKFIIELAHMVKDNGWDNREYKRNNSIN